MKKSLPLHSIFSSVIYKIMLCVLAIYPFGFVAATIWKETKSALWIDDQIIVWVMSISMIGMLAFGHKMISQTTNLQQNISIGFLLFAGAFSLRIIVFLLLQTEPTSDFGICYAYATGYDYDAEFLARYPYLGAYALVLRSFFQLVGASVRNAQILNALLTSCIPVLLFFSIRIVCNRSNFAFTTGMFYAVCPSVVIYSAIPSCEHFSQFFMATLLLFLALFFVRKNETSRGWTYALLSGSAMGAVCIFKELFIILAPTILMTFFCYEILPHLEKYLRKQAGDMKSFLAKTAKGALIIIVAFLVYRAGVIAVQMQIVGRIESRTSPIALSIYEGLSPVGGGGYNEEVKQYTSSLLKSGITSQEVNEKIWKKLLEEYQQSPNVLGDILHHKFFVNWCEEDAYYYWTFNSQQNVIQGSWVGELLFAVVPRIFWLIACGIISIGLLNRLFRRNSTESQPFHFLIVGIVFLFTAALVLIEAQNRYKSSFMPVFSILFAWGIDALYFDINQIKEFAFEKLGKKLLLRKKEE